MDNSLKPLFSIAIPTWEINGKGAEYLEHSFNILAQQTFQDFEIVISDHSLNDDIKDVCYKWFNSNLGLSIVYVRNDIGRGKIAPNINNAIKHCNGGYIKILFQDDFLYNVDSLEMIFNSITINLNQKWFITGCAHTKDCIDLYDPMAPYYHDRIYAGINTISCPSVLTIKNEDLLLFNETLNWLVDVEYYKRLYDKHGYPTVIESICTVNRDSDVRTTTMITEQQKIEETQRVISWYENK
jgi:glycosyltransferase involved in cell wall biosynthesis